MEEFLVRERITRQMKQVNSLAVEIMPALDSFDAGTLYTTAVDKGREQGGRILVLDNNGVVMADGFSLLNGVKLGYREVQDIQLGEKDFSYGFHLVAALPQQGESTEEGKSTWMVYYTSAIIKNAKTIGVLVFSTSIQDVVDKTGLIREQLAYISAGICVVIVGLSIIISRLITRPINEMMHAILYISRGRFDRRVKVSGKNEMAKLAATFNMMSERLENLDRMRSEFIADASHEMRTPLSSIKILVESMLYQEPEPRVRKEFLQDINNEIDRLNNLVADLMTLSKIDRHSQVAMERVEMASLTERVVKNLYPIAENKGVAVSADLPDELYLVGNEIKLYQAVSNLVDNSIKYTPEGGHVDVSLESRGQFAVLKVSDTGVGIPKEDLPHIFERFYRVDKARSRETGGTGLGLSIAKEITAMHRGMLTVKSEPGKGTTFTLELPLQQAPEGNKEG
ncbi:MAG: ATP-binding protein [Bacillota bacterium]|nr:ATP-binding protein [Bacillota bacterium]